jgi:hypothetical protein
MIAKSAMRNIFQIGPWNRGWGTRFLFLWNDRLKCKLSKEVQGLPLFIGVIPLNKIQNKTRETFPLGARRIKEFIKTYFQSKLSFLIVSL